MHTCRLACGYGGRCSGSWVIGSWPWRGYGGRVDRGYGGWRLVGRYTSWRRWQRCVCDIMERYATRRRPVTEPHARRRRPYTQSDGEGREDGGRLLYQTLALSLINRLGNHVVDVFFFYAIGRRRRSVGASSLTTPRKCSRMVSYQAATACQPMFNTSTSTQDGRRYTGRVSPILAGRPAGRPAARTAAATSHNIRYGTFPWPVLVLGSVGVLTPVQVL
jgi:hypothetical protein